MMPIYMWICGCGSILKTHQRHRREHTRLPHQNGVLLKQDFKHAHLAYVEFDIFSLCHVYINDIIQSCYAIFSTTLTWRVCHVSEKLDSKYQLQACHALLKSMQTSCSMYHEHNYLTWLSAFGLCQTPEKRFFSVWMYAFVDSLVYMFERNESACPHKTTHPHTCVKSSHVPGISHAWSNLLGRTWSPSKEKPQHKRKIDHKRHVSQQVYAGLLS